MRRCEHGVYNPDPDTDLAWGCEACHPNGHPEAPAPVLPRSSGDPLNASRTGELEKCECGAIILSTRTQCGVCQKPYPAGAGAFRLQGTANESSSGTCPACHSTIHYATKKKGVWACADCGEEYPAPKGRKK